MVKLAAPKPIVLRRVMPNAGVRAQYEKRLDALIAEMTNSVAYWLKAEYRANEGRIAQDAAPAVALQKAMRKLSRRWIKNFNTGADKLATWFTNRAFGATQTQLKQILRDAGFSVEFQMTQRVKDDYEAVRAENVNLIRSIPQQYLSDVEGMVMRSVTAGRDLGQLSRELQHNYGVTSRRAALIARDQNNKATAVINKTRQDELGITEGVWKHSHAGKVPRQSHVDADGKRFNINQGMLIDGEYILPGQKINCRCTWAAVIPGLD